MSRSRIALVIVAGGLVACAPSSRPASTAIAPQVRTDPRASSGTDASSIFGVGPRDGMTCRYLPLETEERAAGLSVHLQFTMGSRMALHRIIDLWADTSGPQRLAVTQYRGENWAFDTSWNAIVALSREGQAAGLSITLPPPIVDSSVTPLRVLKGGNITSDLTPEEGQQAQSFARWIWEGRCTAREPRGARASLPSPISHLPSTLELSLPRTAALAHPVRHRDLPRREILLELAPGPILGPHLVAPRTEREQ